MDRILIVEDDLTIKEELMRLLTADGYKPVFSLPCDLALLDIGLQGESGLQICQRIRKTSDVPIIFLTAKDTAEDELLAFSVGADDFIRKPYNSSVLLARIARLLKKNTSRTEVRGLLLQFPDLTAEYEGKKVSLTSNEAKILHFLMEKGLCKKEDIIESLWLSNSYIDENTLYVNINRLREKLASVGASGFIQTVRGVGYKI